MTEWHLRMVRGKRRRDFVSAMATGKPLARAGKETFRFKNDDYSAGYCRGWLDPKYLLAYAMLDIEDVLAKDWVCK